MDAFCGEIRAFPYTFVPQNWLACDGKMYSMALGSLYQDLGYFIGNVFGGDGQSNFCVPNLQGFVVIGPGTAADGNSYTIGETVGQDSVTLTADQMGPHTHMLTSMLRGVPTDSPSNTAFVAGTQSKDQIYPSFAQGGDVNMDPTLVGMAGGGAPHDNHQPYMLFRYCICYSGWNPVQPGDPAPEPAS